MNIVVYKACGVGLLMPGFTIFCKQLLSELYVSIVSPRMEKVFTLYSSSLFEL